MQQALTFLVLFSSVPAATGQATPDDAWFESKVRPLLAERCQSCHSEKAKKQRGGLLLDSREAILKGGDSGSAVVPGDPAKSLLVKAVHRTDPTLEMPPAAKLPPQEIALLAEWVRRGVPFPGAGLKGGQQGGMTVAEGRKFWSFQPLAEHVPPAVKAEGWPRRRVDGFLLAEMERRGLSPSADAPARVLVRRLYFDLVGLPPTPAEVEAFEREYAANPQATYERLIERLLASPQYGERWARYWLDLVRYADVREEWSDAKGAAYLYRDWVVRAINDDVPYDRFVQMQLAADLLPGAEPADRAALGFLGLSPTYWKELKLDHVVIKTVVAEEWEERVQALTGTFLGLTVACARCHDHKFDPVTMKDYYALAGVLASTRLADRSLLPDDETARVVKARGQVKTLEAALAKLQGKKEATPEEVKQRDAVKQKAEEIRKSTPHFDAPFVPGVDEASLHVLPDGPHKTKLVYKPAESQDVEMQLRGNPGKTGPAVPRRFLEVLSPDPPTPFKQGSGRLELARATTTDAAPLLARVFVNRVWRHHFGSGLVETPSDFGTQGERPSHPQLLDDLAARFVKYGRSLKWLHREILLSAAYRQTSARDERKQAVDPDNRLLWRMNRRRLDVEAWRDAMLAAAGTLASKLGGPPQELGDLNNRRRTLYGTVKRRELNDVLRLHDFPDPTTHSPARIPTTTPLQQLYTLNSPFVQQQSQALAKRLQAEAGDDEARVRRVYWLLYGRPATEAHVRLGVGFVRATSWAEYTQVLLGGNEFVFVD